MLWSLTCSRPTWVQNMAKSVPNMVWNGLKKEGAKSEKFVVEPDLLTTNLDPKYVQNRFRIWSGTVSKKRVQNLKKMLWSLTCSRPTWVQNMTKSVPNMLRNSLEKEGAKSDFFVVEPALLTTNLGPKYVRICSKYARHMYCGKGGYTPPRLKLVLLRRGGIPAQPPNGCCCYVEGGCTKRTLYESPSPTWHFS